MDLELGWLFLLGVPLVFVLGWLASRLDVRQLKIENQDAPKAYFQGLNFLLNEQQDKAIDAFIEGVQNDPDTLELHFALGNLFRRRGEYARAVRVHEHLLARADLSASDRERAHYALAQDFVQAGLMDRAEDALRKVQGTRFQSQADVDLLALCEIGHDWVRAEELAQKLEATDHGSFSVRRAHYLCEQAAQAEPQTARTLLEKAIQVAPHAPRPRLELARLLSSLGESEAALAMFLAAAEVAPAALPLMATRLAQVAVGSDQVQTVLNLLRQHYEQTASLDVLQAIIELEAQRNPLYSVQAGYAQHLEREPSLIAAARWLGREDLSQEPRFAPVQRALDHAVKPLSRYRCAACGFETQQHFWQCPGCRAWDSYPTRRVEEL